MSSAVFKLFSKVSSLPTQHGRAAVGENSIKKLDPFSFSGREQLLDVASSSPGIHFHHILARYEGSELVKFSETQKGEKHNFTLYIPAQLDRPEVAKVKSNFKPDALPTGGNDFTGEVISPSEIAIKCYPFSRHKDAASGGYIKTVHVNGPPKVVSLVSGGVIKASTSAGDNPFHKNLSVGRLYHLNAQLVPENHVVPVKTLEGGKRTSGYFFKYTLKLKAKVSPLIYDTKEERNDLFYDEVSCNLASHPFQYSYTSPMDGQVVLRLGREQLLHSATSDGIMGYPGQYALCSDSSGLSTIHNTEQFFANFQIDMVFLPGSPWSKLRSHLEIQGGMDLVDMDSSATSLNLGEDRLLSLKDSQTEGVVQNVGRIQFITVKVYDDDAAKTNAHVFHLSFGIPNTNKALMRSMMDTLPYTNCLALGKFGTTVDAEQEAEESTSVASTSKLYDAKYKFYPRLYLATFDSFQPWALQVSVAMVKVLRSHYSSLFADPSKAADQITELPKDSWNNFVCVNHVGVKQLSAFARCFIVFPVAQLIRLACKNLAAHPSNLESFVEAYVGKSAWAEFQRLHSAALLKPNVDKKDLEYFSVFEAALSGAPRAPGNQLLLTNGDADQVEGNNQYADDEFKSGSVDRLPALLFGVNESTAVPLRREVLQAVAQPHYYPIKRIRDKPRTPFPVVDWHAAARLLDQLADSEVATQNDAPISSKEEEEEEEEDPTSPGPMPLRQPAIPPVRESLSPELIPAKRKRVEAEEEPNDLDSKDVVVGELDDEERELLADLARLPKAPAKSKTTQPRKRVAKSN